MVGIINLKIYKIQERVTRFGRFSVLHLENNSVLVLSVVYAGFVSWLEGI